MTDLEIFEKFVKDVGFDYTIYEMPYGFRVTIIRPTTCNPNSDTPLTPNNLGLILNTSEYFFTKEGLLSGC